MLLINLLKLIIISQKLHLFIISKTCNISNEIQTYNHHTRHHIVKMISNGNVTIRVLRISFGAVGLRLIRMSNLVSLFVS